MGMGNQHHARTSWSRQVATAIKKFSSNTLPFIIFLKALITFLSIFALTQVPLAIIEGLLTKIVIDNIEKYKIGKGVIENETN